MARRTIGYVVLVSFIWFDFACIIHTSKKTTVAQAVGRETAVLALAKKSGEYIKFPKNSPGRIEGDKVAGISYEELVIDPASIKSRKVNSQSKLVVITTRDGQVIQAQLIGNKEYRIMETTIPLSEVEILWIRKVDAPLSFMATIGAIIAAYYVTLGIIALLKESCPFIYSFDGERYVFDAEPYGGAICEGLKRTEWCELENLKEVNGLYKLKITNEVNETQYTDELALVAVDHPADVVVVPDQGGTFHTLARPLPPGKAYDQYSRDIEKQVQDKDWIYWKTPEDEIAINRSSWKDEIVFEFPKPAEAKKVKFLFNGCNTLWGSQMIKRLLELNGTALQDFYRNVNAMGQAYFARQPWMLREELFRLQVRAEADGGWETKGLLLGGGPFISEDRVYVLDIEDIPGDVLRIKLTPPAGFWMINRVAVDYSNDQPLAPKEITAAEALDQSGRDIRDSLAITDGRYYVMPQTGEWAEITFAAPAQRSAMRRSVFAKVSGYYDIHLNSSGTAQTELLEAFRTKPGYFIQYACGEYLKWKSEMERGRAIR